MLREEIKGIKSSKKDLRKFGLSVGAVLFVVGCVLYWFDKAPHPYFLAIGLSLIVVGGLIPTMLLPIQKVWMTLAVIMGWFMTRLILSMLFYVAFTSIGLLARLTGKQFLELKRPKEQKSYWNYRKAQENRREGLERQF